MTIKLDDGSTVTTKPDNVIKVTLTGTISSADAAASKSTHITAQVKAADDLHTVVSLHQDYLAKYPDAANAADVRASMGAYQKLAASNAVKFRGRWVAKAQIEVILHDWTDAAKPAVDRYKAGHFKEALDAVKAAFDADKENKTDYVTVNGQVMNNGAIYAQSVPDRCHDLRERQQLREFPGNRPEPLPWYLFGDGDPERLLRRSADDHRIPGPDHGLLPRYSGRHPTRR